jgi:hypothetical protein
VGTQGYGGNSGTLSSSVNDCLPDLFDNFLLLEDSEEEEVMTAQAEPMATSTLINKDECLLPSMEYDFLNTYLDINSMSGAIHQGGDSTNLKWWLALAGMRACEVSTLGLTSEDMQALKCIINS